MQPLPLLGTGPRTQLIEDVVVPLRIVHCNHTRALQQVGADGSAHDAPLLVKLDLGELPETRRIRVADSFGISECFKERVRLQHFRLNTRRSIGKRPALRIASQECQILHTACPLEEKSSRNHLPADSSTTYCYCASVGNEHHAHPSIASCRIRIY